MDTTFGSAISHDPHSEVPALLPEPQAFADAFVPPAPQSLQAAELDGSQIGALILKFMLNHGAASGRDLADQVALPFRLVEPVLFGLKSDRLVVLKGTALAGDYIYELTDGGVDRARRHGLHSTYCGSAPVSLADYVVSVAAQSVRKQQPQMADLRRTFADLVLSDDVLGRIGEAISSGLGFFLYGEPGNGKTSIAERVTGVYGDVIWIPRAIAACGEIIRIYDSSLHELAPPAGDELPDGRKIDSRWVRIRRPTIIVGGELTMDHLEVSTNPATGVREAPLHIKSNGGTLVIDDFGRQRISPSEMLNRWVTLLERRYDFLDSASGRKFHVPIDQLIIFSTNIPPRDLVDEAFLRRIPYKIDIVDPPEDEFREVFRRTAQQMNLEYDEAAVDYLLETHFRQAGRHLRYCHPRDLCQQMQTAFRFHGRATVVTHEAIDAAVRNYFAIV